VDVRSWAGGSTSLVEGAAQVPAERSHREVMIMLYRVQQDYDVLTGKATDKPPMSPEDVAAMHAYMETLHKELAEAGVLVDARGLTAPAHARRVRLDSGVPVVTDGPYPETQEVLAGLTIVDCASFDRATQIAARFINPDAKGEYVDVRPIIDSMTDLDF
jgi:hypothetical protein